ncbi:Cof-type HAD-IIB family hydrolase [Clostridium isatidis]|uniref:Hydrolase n=1 Tax=Clostridium isatidis TaxID=182773 RepID=A0A343JCN3_9CLOT|nr:Cof-type HAD-IIB family hydrolase [Clostridium isatidis]ASW43291.1 hypothetical protein BEN51_07280 [Clostridium isatidis]
MKRKLIFIDVDGTLCGLDGQVPESAKKAINIARSKGHLVLLCTGRSKAEITEDISSIGFDGMICAGGGYIEINEEVLFHKKMPIETVKEIIEYFNLHNIDYYIESNDGIFGSSGCINAIIRQVTKGFEENSSEYEKAKNEMNWFFKILNQYKDKEINYNNINKISFISNGHPYEEVYNTFKRELEIYHSTVPQFGENSGEIGIKGINKAKAIDYVIKYLNIDKSDTLAYGDGENDIDMFKSVNHGVAMENARPNLIKVAKEITYTAESNGIYLSFKKNNLI